MAARWQVSVGTWQTIFQATKDSSKEQVRKSYLRLCKLLHPDKTNDEGAKEAFQSVTRLFDKVKDGKHKFTFVLPVQPKRSASAHNEPSKRRKPTAPARATMSKSGNPQSRNQTQPGPDAQVCTCALDFTAHIESAP